MSSTPRHSTFRRGILPILVLTLALAALLVAWPATTVAVPTGGGCPPEPGGCDPTCHGQCSIDALACNIDCWERYRWDPDLVDQCQLGCQATLDACVAACP